MTQRILILLFAALGIGAVACAAIAWYPQQAVGLFAEPNLHDLGQCEQGTTQTLQYTIWNRTKDSVELLGIADTCSCSRAVISKNQLRPGENAEVSVEWRLGNARGKRSLPILLNVRQQPGAPEQVLLLSARATVRGDIEVDSDLIDFTSGQTAVRKLQVTYRSDRYRVRHAYGSHASISVRWDPVTNRAQITFVPERWLGLGNAVNVLLDTDRPDEPVIRVPVRIAAGS